MIKTKHIVIFGGGRSTQYLLYLLNKVAAKERYKISVIDTQATNKSYKHITFIQADGSTPSVRHHIIQQANLVISMLPPELHVHIAKDCITHQTPCLTSSYLSDDMFALNKSAIKNKVLILNECGLDPGIDHIIALKMIRNIHHQHGEITSFISACGGIPANPKINKLQYAITWNPKNIVNLCKEGASYLHNNKTINVTQQTIFNNPQQLKINSTETLELLPNRDSIKFIKPYHLNNTTSFLRGTLRYKGFSKEWLRLLQQYNFSFNPFQSEKEKEFFSYLLTHYQLLENEVDRIVLFTQIKYSNVNKKQKTETYLLDIVGSSKFSAMSKSVGTCLFAASKAILNKNIKLYGIQTPMNKDIWPILDKEIKKTSLFRSK